jgi:hypothetical protein
MGVAANLVVRHDQPISFVDVFAAEGFQVTVSARKLGDGSRTSVYKCTRGKERFGFILLPLRKDRDYTAIMLLAKPRFSDLMIWARDTLQKRGALDQTEYEATRIT